MYTHALGNALTHTGMYIHTHIHTYKCTHLRSGVDGGRCVHNYTERREQKNDLQKKKKSAILASQFLPLLVVPCSDLRTPTSCKTRVLYRGFPDACLLPWAEALLGRGCRRVAVTAHTGTPQPHLRAQPCCSPVPPARLGLAALLQASTAGGAQPGLISHQRRFPHRPVSPFAFFFHLSFFLPLPASRPARPEG